MNAGPTVACKFTVLCAIESDVSRQECYQRAWLTLGEVHKGFSYQKAIMSARMMLVTHLVIAPSQRCYLKQFK